MSKREAFDFDHNLVINENSLGLNKRVQKQYSDKDYNDVISELDSISEEELFNTVKDFCKKRGYSIVYPSRGSVSFPNSYVEVSWINKPREDGHSYKALVTIEIVENENYGVKFFTWSPWFLFDRKYVKVYVDYILDADVCKTYAWYEMYQYWASLPYEMTRSNAKALIKGIDKFAELTRDNFMETLASNPQVKKDDVEKAAEECYKQFITYDLWEYARSHGALVPDEENESFHDISLLTSQGNIFAAINESKASNVLERIEEGIYASTLDKARVKQDKKSPDVFWIVSESGISKRSIDMSKSPGWTPLRESDTLEDPLRTTLLVEDLSREASKFINMPSCIRAVKIHESQAESL